MSQNIHFILHCKQYETIIKKPIKKEPLKEITVSNGIKTVYLFSDREEDRSNSISDIYNYMIDTFNKNNNKKLFHLQIGNPSSDDCLASKNKLFFSIGNNEQCDCKNYYNFRMIKKYASIIKNNSKINGVIL